MYTIFIVMIACKSVNVLLVSACNLVVYNRYFRDVWLDWTIVTTEKLRDSEMLSSKSFFGTGSEKVRYFTLLVARVLGCTCPGLHVGCTWG